MNLISKTQQVFVKYLEHLSEPVVREEAELVAVSGVQDSYSHCAYNHLPEIYARKFTIQV